MKNHYFVKGNFLCVNMNGEIIELCWFNDKDIKLSIDQLCDMYQETLDSQR